MEQLLINISQKLTIIISTLSHSRESGKTTNYLEKHSLITYVRHKVYIASRSYNLIRLQHKVCS